MRTCPSDRDASRHDSHIDLPDKAGIPHDNALGSGKIGKAFKPSLELKRNLAGEQVDACACLHLILRFQPVHLPPFILPSQGSRSAIIAQHPIPGMLRASARSWHRSSWLPWRRQDPRLAWLRMPEAAMQITAFSYPSLTKLKAISSLFVESGMAGSAAVTLQSGSLAPARNVIMTAFGAHWLGR